MRFSPSILAVSLLTSICLLPACGGGGGTGTAATGTPGGGNPAPSALIPIPEDLYDLTILEPTAAGTFATSATSIRLAGMGHGETQSLGWASDRGGAAAITPAVQWSTVVPLQPGENRITVKSVVGGDEQTDTIWVLSDPAIRDLGTLEVDPAGGFTGEDVTITARLAVRLAAAPTAVELFESDLDGTPTTTLLATLTDDASAGSGDTTAGDHEYTGRTIANRAAPDVMAVRARVTHPGGTLWSAPALLTFRDRLQTPDVEACVALQEQAFAAYEAARDSGGDHEDGFDAAVALLEASPLVSLHGRAEDGYGLWIIFQAGFAGGLLLSPPGTKGGCSREGCNPVPDASYGVFDTIEGTTWTRRSTGLIEPMESEGPEIRALMDGHPCVQFDPATYEQAAAFTVDGLLGMSPRGVLAFSSHGENWYQDPKRSPLDPAFGARAGMQGTATSLQEIATGQAASVPVVMTGEIYDGAQLTDERRHGLLARGRLTLMTHDEQTYWAFTPAFVGLLPCLPRSLVYVSACRSTYNDELAKAFLARGAVAFVGYDSYVAASFAETQGIALFTALCDGKTLREAWDPSANDNDATDPSFMKCFGDLEARLPVDGLANAGFEFRLLAPGNPALPPAPDRWLADKVGVLTSMGDIRPPDSGRCNRRFAGLAKNAVLGQQVCVPTDATGLRFHCNIVSEDWTELCTSPPTTTYFLAKLGDLTIVATTLGSRCDDVTAVNAGWPNVPGDDNGTWQTGWIPVTLDVTALRGTTQLLELRTREVIDGKRTFVLVDEFEFVRAP